MAEPFFILGFQRSGTTLLRVMLDAHPQVAIPLDTVGLWDRYERKLAGYDGLTTAPGRERIVTDLLAEDRIKLWKAPLTREGVLALWTDGTYPGMINAFYLAYAGTHGKQRWGDKDPGNMTRVDQINRWFPRSRVVHIVRDGRDACLSQMDQSFGFDNILECASSWREEVQWVRRMGGLLGPRYMELRYEDLVANPEEQLRKVCVFLELPYHESMLKYHETIDRSVPAEKRHVWPLIGKPPVSDNAGRWKRALSHGQRICFEKRAGQVLKDLDYEVLPKATGAYLEEMRNFGSAAWRALIGRFRLKGSS